MKRKVIKTLTDKQWKGVMYVMNKLIGPSEHDIQNAIYSLLGAYGWLVWRNNSGMVAAVSAKGRRYAVRMGRPGLPDLFAIRNGLLLGIEVKRPGKQATPIQQYMLRELEAHGAYTIVAHSVDEVQAFISKVI